MRRPEKVETAPARGRFPSPCELRIQLLLILRFRLRSDDARFELL